MEELLNKFHCSELLECFKDHGIDEEALLILTPGHLKEIVPKNLFGARVKLEHALRSENKENVLDVSDSNQITALSILSQSILFKGITNYYRMHKRLELKHRKAVCGIICDYLISKNIDWLPKKFEVIAADITYLFPTEVKETYYLQIKNKRASGLLYSKYRNSLQKARSSVEESFAADLENYTADKDADDYGFNWLLCHSDSTEDLDEILPHWESSYRQRAQSLSSSGNLDNVLKDWPILKQSFGFKLINIDFIRKFPGKEFLLCEKFSTFKDKCFLVAERRLKELFSIQIFKSVQGASEDSVDVGIFLIIHALLVPTARRAVTRGAPKKFCSKITIADSRKSFFVSFPTVGELMTYVKTKIENLYIENGTLQPIVYGIGPSDLECKEFFVYFADIYYKFDSILKAVDACFKVFMVLDIEYPLECKLVWLFIQKYFFDIEIQPEEKTACILSFINDLNT